MLEHLGRLPDEGEEVEIHGVRFCVLAAKDAQIHELRLISTPGPRARELALAALDREPAVQQAARLAGRVGRVQQHDAELDRPRAARWRRGSGPPRPCSRSSGP